MHSVNRRRCGQIKVLFLFEPFRIGYKTGMRHALICLLLTVVCSVKADVLFRDDRQGHGYIFESDRKDIEATVSQDEALDLAIDWAMSFYGDESLEVAVSGGSRWRKTFYLSSREKVRVINILLVERSKSRVGVDCGDGARGRMGFDRSTFCR